MPAASPSKASAVEDEQAKRAKISKIQNDATLTDAEKMQRIQALHGGSKWLAAAEATSDPLEGLSKEERDSITCGICMDIVSRPVTLPCQHNMCLDCLKGIRKMDANMRKCPYCRKELSAGFIDNARINMAMVSFVRARKAQCAGRKTAVAARVHVPTKEEEERPEEAFITNRAVRKGMANAASGSLKMTCPVDHFGPIGPEFDPRWNRGVVVGDMYPNRMACRMWNVHLPHVAGIAGQGNRGAQSVVLSGGYVDDVDEGEFFLYTGSGGKDLSGNKRNGAHDRDQEFSRYNLAIKRSCEEGLPVRVVRSHKEKRSAYAPKLESLEEMQEAAAGKKKSGRSRKSAAAAADDDDGQPADDEEDESEGQDDSDGEESESGSDSGSGSDDAASDADGEGEDEDGEAEGGEEGGQKKGSIQLAKAIAHNPVRYDGIYRVLACWRAKGEASYLVCRYLFVRCDNAPAPWSSDDCGDKPRLEIPQRAAKEIADAKKLGEEVTYMTKTPFWDYDPVTEQWGWTRPPPVGKAAGPQRGPKQEKPLEKQIEAARREVKRLTKQLTDSYSCLLCHQVATRPVYTPCAHIYCMDCLKTKLDGGGGPARHNARPSRASSQRKPCPARSCGKDLTAFMKDAQVNTTMASQAAAASEAVRRKEAEVAALQRRMDGIEEQAAAQADATEDKAADNDDTARELQKPQKARADSTGDVDMADGSASAAEAAADEEEAKDPARPPAEAVATEAEEGPSPGPDVEPAAATADGAARWQAEATCLAERYPEFDAALISGMLEDQGGDVREVDAYLKSIKRSQQRTGQSPKRKASGPAGADGDGNGPSKRGRKKGGARGSKAAAAAKQQAAAAEEDEEEDDDKDMIKDEKAAAAGADAELDAEEGGEGEEVLDVKDTKGKRQDAARGNGKGTKAAAARGKAKKEPGMGVRKDGKAEAAGPSAAKRRKTAA